MDDALSLWEEEIVFTIRGASMKQATAGNTGLHPLRMLHIGPALGESGVGAQLAQLNLSIEQEPNVYRGLALLSLAHRVCAGGGHRRDEGHIGPVRPRVLPTNRDDIPPSAHHTMNDPVQTSFLGVVVCVDELVTGEYEFFSLAKRFADLHGVYVYSCCGDEGSVRRAVTLGATGLLTDEVLTSLRLTIDESLRCSTAADSATGSTILGDGELLPQEAEQKDMTVDSPSIVKSEVTHLTADDEADVDVVGCQDEDDSDTATDSQPCATVVETDEVLVEDEDDLIGPVQVPWDRRPSSPLRAAPPQRSEPTSTVRKPPVAAPSSEVTESDDSGDNSHHNEEPSTVAKPKHQPLLTPEELRALIGEPENTTPLEDRPQGDDEGAKLGT